MTELDRQFWKPDKETVISLSKFRKKPKKKKPSLKQRKREAREKLIQHFGLQKYATNMAICMMIEKEAGWRLPGSDAKAGKMIFGYYKKLKEIARIRQRPQKSDKDFYASPKWRELRYIALKNSGGVCTLCGASARDGVQLHVDHVKPRSRFPELQYDLDNLQILCSDCNLGKSNYDDTDWR